MAHKIAWLMLSTERLGLTELQPRHPIASDYPIISHRLSVRSDSHCRGLPSPRWVRIGGFACYAHPLFGEPVRPPKVADVFVLMPFAEDMKPFYLDHIRPTVRVAIPLCFTSWGSLTLLANQRFSSRVIRKMFL